MALAFILICAVFILLIVEARATRRSVERIPVRIFVNGTRGKSTTVEYLAAALRTRGMKVIGKVTGELPSLILADGTKRVLRRWGPARIQEQFRVIRRAAASGAEALVLECMSIDPVLQETESRFFKPQIYLLTNIRDDHREKLGSTHGDQLAAMCRAIPNGCVLVTADKENLATIGKEAKRKRCTLVVADGLKMEDQVAGRGGEGAPGDGVFMENMALALEAAAQTGMDREEAHKAIREYLSGKETREKWERMEKGKIHFLNAFPANDPESATLSLDKWPGGPGRGEKLVLIFNTRSDRPLRTELFSDWIRDRKGLLRAVFITGDHRARAFARLKDLEPAVDVYRIGRGRIEGLSERLILRYGDPLWVAGIGNFRGEGYRVIKEFKR